MNAAAVTALTVEGTLMPLPSRIRIPGPNPSTADISTYHPMPDEGTMTADLKLVVYENTRRFILTSSTSDPQVNTSSIEDVVDRTFDAAAEEDFEDGMDSRFSNKLLSIVKCYGNIAMQEISYLILYRRVNNEVSSEALRWLGRLDDKSTYNWRLWLLERCLTSSSPQIRDSASLGLASLGDIHAIPYLKGAIGRETYVELRDNIKQVLDELGAARDAASAKKNTSS